MKDISDQKAGVADRRITGAGLVVASYCLLCQLKNSANTLRESGQPTNR